MTQFNLQTPMKAIFVFTLSFFSTLSSYAQSYSERYFALLDYLVTYPYDFLGKTEFELANLQEPPEGMPVSEDFWSVKLLEVPGGGVDYDFFFEITTGYSPLYVNMAKNSRLSFNLRFAGSNSLGVTFSDLRNHLELRRGVVFDKDGFSQILQDRGGRGAFYLGLSLWKDIPIVNIIAVSD